jgi:hypothetical protein
MDNTPPVKYKRKADSVKTVSEPRRGERKRRQPGTDGLLRKPHPEQKYGAVDGGQTEEEKEIQVIGIIKEWATVWMEDPVFNPNDEAVIMDFLLAMCKVHFCSTRSLTHIQLPLLCTNSAGPKKHSD